MKRNGKTTRPRIPGFLLVNLDNEDDLNAKVKTFVRSRKLRSRVVLLGETDLNTWLGSELNGKTYKDFNTLQMEKPDL